MKNTIFFLLLTFIFFNAEAQYDDWTEAKVYLKDGTTLEGHARLTYAVANASGLSINLGSKEYLRFINFEIKQKRSTKFTPEEIDKVVFDLNYKVKGRRLKRKATFIPVIMFKNEKNKKIRLGFAELVIDGFLKLVEKPVVANGTGSHYAGAFLIRRNEQAVLLNSTELKSFKKRASEYFKDCPNLILKIESKIYTRKDSKAIIKFYNDNCAK
ncbi:MAG: hypothetical protein ABJL44_02760 [Algibacter sp.]